jgi:hypothetical protein
MKRYEITSKEWERIKGLFPTERTDANSLMGRPNQYTSKVNFADKRVEQSDSKNSVE